MYEDEPQDRVHDILADAVLGGSPMGRRVLGEARSSPRSRSPTSRLPHSHTGPNLVVCAAGHVEHDHIVELASGLARRRRRRAPSTRTEAGPRRRRCFASTRRTPSSSTSASAAPGIARERRAPLRAGGPRRDLRRLNLVAALPRDPREARPRLRGRLLHRAVHRRRAGRHLRGHARGQRRGGVRGDRRRAREAPLGAGLRRGARARQGERQGPPRPSLESTAARMTRASRAPPSSASIDTLDEMLAKVDAVTVDDLTALAAELYGAERLSAACIGSDEDASARRSARSASRLAAA